MNIEELDAYNLDDAVKFHDRLNPRLWDDGEQLRPEVRSKLLEIAADFEEFLGLNDVSVKDITISGSNAAYSYTDHSDIDLHLVVDMPTGSGAEVYRELFDAKKYQYNDLHNISIGGADVELYVQDADQPHHSQGIYSVKNDQWISVPRRRSADVNDSAVQRKYQDLGTRIENILSSKDYEQLARMMTKIKTMRAAGLEREGEFGVDNIVFKLLRNNGLIQRLVDARSAARDAELSLTERKRKKKSSRVRYGYGGYWTPGFNFGGTELGGEGGGDGGGGESIREASTPDGVSASTKMFLEQDADSVADIIQDFVGYCVSELGIAQAPRLQLRRDPAWSQRNRSFGRFDPKTNRLDVSTADRHVMDVLRTVAHELVHHHQQEQQDLPADAGETGSEYENEANARAGELMRSYGRSHPELFGSADLEEDWKQRLGGAALAAACAVGAPGCATTGQLAQGAQIAARTAQTMQGRNIKDIARAELEQEIKNYARAQRGDANAQNLSRIYQAQRRQPQNESSGYIPTEKERNDPRFKMALSPDVRPGATGKNANKMSLKTGPQGEPQLLIKGLKNALREFKETGGLPLTEDQDLFEINMSPSNLERLVRDIDARAGIEFEMIVPGVDVDQDEEQEPDYDYDERVDSIADAERFFDDGDYNSSRSVRGMVESMYEDYETWKMEQLDEKWSEDGKDYLRDYIDRNNLFDRDEYMDQAREYVREKFADLAGIDQESEAFQDAVTERLDDIADEFAADAWDNQDNGYSDAQEEFNDDYADGFEESAWLRDQDYRHMTDIQNAYNMEWPYWQTVGGDGEMDIDSVADDFSRAIGRPVNASSQYHGGRREPGHYVVEPDSSLDPDNSGDGGLEFVSPPLPLDELLSDMDKVRDWAKQRGCYTNNSTGLHMNVSVPNTSTAKLDYVKLALLLGDERVLAEFGRSANTYAKSALGKIRDILKRKPEAAEEVLNKMREHMEALATKVIHTGNTDKYTSINTKDNYVEFRSPGGDWLDENWDRVKPTLLRTVVALDAAMDPEKYRKEYQKKLYKLLDSSKQNVASPSVNKLLSMYFTTEGQGEGSREIAIKLAKEILSRKDLEKQVGTPGKQFWWSVQKGNDRMEVVASTDGEALDVAAKEWGLSGADRMPNATATILRPYVAPPAQTANGRWGIWISDANKFTVGDGEIRRWDSKDDAELWLKLRRESQPNTRADLEVREIPNDYQQPGRVETDQQQTYYVHNGRYNTSSFQAPSREAAIDHFRNNWDQTGTFQLRSSTDEVIYNPAQTQTNAGEWGVWVPSLDRYATIGNAGPRRFENKAEAQAWIEDYHQRNAGRDLNLQASKIVNTFKAFDVGNGNTLGTFRASGPKGSQPANIAFSQYIQSLGRTNTAGYDYDEAEPLPDLFPDIPQQPAASRPAADELPEVPLDIEIERAPRTLTTPGQPQQTFSGEWKIVDADGQELHRFGGVGNVQADANATAIRWLQQNPRLMQAGVEVVPVMSE